MPSRRAIYLLIICLSTQVPCLLADSELEPELTANPVSLTPLNVVYSYNTRDPVYQRQSAYVGLLVDLLMRKSGVPYELSVLPVETTPEVRTARRIHKFSYITAMHTTSAFEKNLRAIPYPIYMGLTGWRAFFVRTADLERFSKIKTLEELQKFIAGQGNNWADNEILEHNGLSVVTAVNRDSLFKFLTLKRVDYFPRGLYEIEREYMLFAPQNIAIEPSIILRYPTATYLFVPRENEKLAHALTAGFERAVSDGSFQALLMRELGVHLKLLNLDKRRILDLENPSHPESLPLNRPELWFDLNMLYDNQPPMTVSP